MPENDAMQLAFLMQAAQTSGKKGFSYAICGFRVCIRVEHPRKRSGTCHALIDPPSKVVLRLQSKLLPFLVKHLQVRSICVSVFQKQADSKSIDCSTCE